MAHMIRNLLCFSLALFFIIGCAEPMAVQATYLPVDWHCDDDRRLDRSDDGRFEALSPSPGTFDGEELDEGLFDVDDALFAPPSLESLYGAYPNERVVAAAPIFGQASRGLSFVVYRDEAEPSQQAAASAPKGVVNINEATAAQLTLLPGIGPSLAQRIVEYRQNRRFAQPQHLRRVRGIGPAKYEQLKEHVVVEGETTMR
jgi:competence ComEA-like helix-hairpin-helix protein